MNELTELEKNIVAYCEQVFIEDLIAPPSMEVASKFGLSTSKAREIIRDLRLKGYFKEPLKKHGRFGSTISTRLKAFIDG